MAFRDRLQPASFRGVPFGVRAADAEFGRQTVQHEYPGRSTPWTEDLGRRGRSFNVDGFLVGEDALQQLDRLRRAAETAGPATLVHPWLGSLEVSLERLRVQTSANEGRFVALEFQFVEAGEQVFPASISDPRSAAEEVAELSRLAAVAAFLRTVQADTLDAADFVRGGLDQGVDLVVKGLRLVAIARGTDPARELFDEIGQLARLVGGFEGGTATASGLPASLRAAVAAVPDASGGGIAGLRSLEALAGTSLPAVTALSAAGQQSQKNTRAVVALLRELSLAELVRLAASIEWESYQAATAWRDRILALLEAQLDQATDEAFESIRDLIAQLMKSVPPPLEELPQLATVEAFQTTPAAVLAYELFGTADEGDAIAARNRIRRPSFVPGGTALEVLIPA